MQITDDVEERIALIADGCNISQAEAQAIYDKTQHVAPEHYADKVSRLRELNTLQKMGKRQRESYKVKAAGE